MLRLGNFSPQTKLLFHTKSINNWLQGDNVYPILVEFDLTNRCNHKCDFCTFDYIKDRSTIDMTIVTKTLDEFSKYGVKAINWTGGGEPLLHKDFSKIVTYANSLGIDQGLFTNGSLLNKENSEAILKTHSWIRISIDAGTKETYKNIRKVDDFDLVLNKIQELITLKKKMNSTTSIGIGFVITPENFIEMWDFAKLIRTLYVDYGQYKPCIKNFNSKEQIDSNWWYNDIIPILEDICRCTPKAVVNFYKLNDLIESNFDKKYKECYGHIFCPCIGATGDVWVCTHLRGIDGYSFGNLNEQSFEEIWTSSKRQEVIKKINLDICQFCCKNNEINKILYQIKNPNKETHYNFL